MFIDAASGKKDTTSATSPRSGNSVVTMSGRTESPATR
jgi:hypothetical protein